MARPLLALAILFAQAWKPALAQPRTCAVGLVITDKVEVSGLPAHLRARHPQLIAELDAKVQSLLSQLGRLQIFHWDATFSADRYQYRGVGEVDYVVHIFLSRADKIFSNRIVPISPMMGLPSGYGGGGQGAGLNYEVVSLPAISDRLEIRLVAPGRKKVLWSAQRDSTLIVPFDPQGFIFNTHKYPGFTPPRLLREHLAGLLRLRQDNRAVDRLLEVADRWFVSKPAAELKASQELLGTLVQSLIADLDCNLPIEGRITRLLPGETGESLVEVDLGARHGLAPALHLEVWRALPATEKVGELEVVSVDSTTATARLKSLAKKIRKQGEGLQPLDRVISPTRPPKGRRNIL